VFFVVIMISSHYGSVIGLSNWPSNFVNLHNWLVHLIKAWPSNFHFVNSHNWLVDLIKA